MGLSFRYRPWYHIFLGRGWIGRCDKLLTQARNNPRGLRFSELCGLAECFGWVHARTRGSHRVYKLREHTMSFQDANGFAKPYQVRQLLEAIDSLRKEGE